jgi:hypothetical protein
MKLTLFGLEFIRPFCAAREPKISSF